MTNVCVADDNYVMSDDPRKLQSAIDIVAHYGRRYRVVFWADKTKVTVTGSRVDMAIKMWSLNGERISVTEDNDHLSVIVSGLEEEVKNLDKHIQSTRNCQNPTQP